MKKIIKPRNHGVQGRGQETFDRILNAATLILASESDSFTTNILAQKLNMSVGNLYQYFPNKITIWGEVIEREFNKDRACVISFVQAHRGRKLQDIVEGMFELSKELDKRPAHLKLKILEGLGVAQKMESFLKLNEEMFLLIKELLLSAPDWPKKKSVDFYTLLLMSGTVSLLRSNEMLKVMNKDELLRIWRNTFTGMIKSH